MCQKATGGHDHLQKAPKSSAKTQQPKFTFWLIAGFNFFLVLLQIEAVVKCQNRQQIVGKINIRDKSEALVVCKYYVYSIYKYPPTL